MARKRHTAEEIVAKLRQVDVLLGRINLETGTRFLISTHDENIARRCSRQIGLLDGRVVKGEE